MTLQEITRGYESIIVFVGDDEVIITWNHSLILNAYLNTYECEGKDNYLSLATHTLESVPPYLEVCKKAEEWYLSGTRRSWKG